MPQSETEIITDMVNATGGVAPLISLKTARERIPSIDAEQEEERMRQQTAEIGQQSLDQQPGPFQIPPPSQGQGTNTATYLDQLRQLEQQGSTNGGG